MEGVTAWTDFKVCLMCTKKGPHTTPDKLRGALQTQRPKLTAYI